MDGNWPAGELRPADLDEVEMLVLRAKVIDGDAGVVAVGDVDPCLYIGAATARMGGPDTAEPAQRHGDCRAGRKGQIEELPIVVKDLIGIDEVRRKDLAVVVLEAPARL
jgi:hypothetical protein